MSGKIFETIGIGFVVVCMFTFIANAIILNAVKSDIIRLEQFVVTYAHSNGGFVDSDRTFRSFLNQAITDLNLDGKINNVELSHPINQKLQKGTEFKITVTPSFKIILPFTDKVFDVKGIPVERTGITRNYYKELD